MDTKTLEEKLDSLGIKETAYSFDGTLKNSALNMFQDNNKWEVFFCDEDGERTIVDIFDTEAEACEAIYKIFWI
ncbi:hypothetical protein M2132_000824 [Dysgonomonas sp. PH5-45]|uniref:hypothetical protein n=1 Tax=unclassified Dysgonomonas TaxID=2630389 RepID=UPI002473A8B2|nr:MULTISPECIES: hypothetical protein [unclassified Dysgonomonas]MDH6354496.1 hypothetical protein [Dysgonomonas sp. PH5-45]MDH6387447.1 hypothetical protein [Dysgonomonas sp. PH5-37]